MPTYSSIDTEFIRSKQKELLASWLSSLSSSGIAGDRRTSLVDVEQQAKEFLELLISGLQGGNIHDIQSGNWEPVRKFLESFSRERALQGFSAEQTATFIFSFKKPLFSRLKNEFSRDAEALAEETWLATQLLDKMGMLTVRAFQRSREEVINRQQEEMLELSTPVVKLWDGILALPIIGTLDSARTQVVMESLLQAIVQTNSRVAIIDITGVPTVDTVVAQHLLKTVTAARLMGADCIISGVRPQIAQTIVHLGINLSDVTTKASLAAAFKVALERAGIALAREMPKEMPRKS